MASLTTPGIAGKAPALGGRSTDPHGINDGLIRCPRCSSRLLSQCGILTSCDPGAGRVLWMPLVPTQEEKEEARTAKAELDAQTADKASADESLVEKRGVRGDSNHMVADEMFVWKKEDHEWWWRVEDVNDFDNVGLSRLVQSPHGLIKVVLCSECGNGPFGHQRDQETQLWVACNRVEQVDASLANDELDFKPPDGIDLAALKQMIESGAATTRFHVVFEEQRLGMMLADMPGGAGGVQVVAFTVTDDEELGPAELCGKIQIGDVVTRVNGRSTAGLDYAGVLNLICNAPRPITLHWERSGKGSTNAQIASSARVRHQAWNGFQTEGQEYATLDSSNDKEMKR